MEILIKILTDPKVNSMFVMTVISIMSVIISKLNKIKSQMELDQENITNIGLSNKRGSLRSEYLQIYNSPLFTNEQKYHLTRDIIRDYVSKSGNHYMEELDKGLKQKAEERPNEIEK